MAKLISELRESKTSMLNEVSDDLHKISEHLKGELFNVITHSVALGMAIVGCSAIIVMSAFTLDPWRIVGSSIYGVTLVLLFLSSTIYHAMDDPALKLKLRKADHSAIYLFIASTYTLVIFVWFRGTLGWAIFAVIWSIAITGIILKQFKIQKYKFMNALPYLIMGWIIMFVIKPVVAIMPVGGIVFLIAGGVFYTLGVIFYTMKGKYSHGVWHLFVLFGSVCHYLMILFYVVPLQE